MTPFSAFRGLPRSLFAVASGILISLISVIRLMTRVVATASRSLASASPLVLPISLDTAQAAVNTGGAPSAQPSGASRQTRMQQELGRHGHYSSRASGSASARLGILCALVFLLGARFVSVAEAATIEVTSTAADRGSFTELQCLPPGSDVDAGPSATTVTGGSTLAAAQAAGGVTLREAICVANNTPEPVVIVLSPATYRLTIADNFWYGPNGLPPIGNNITIEGNGAVIEREPANSDGVLDERFRFFFVPKKTLTDGIAIAGGADRAILTLKDLTLRNGFARGGAGSNGGGGAGMGGAIFNQGRVTLRNVTFEGNTARGGSVISFFPLTGGTGGGIGRDGGAGGGFGPGQFGGGLGGSALFDPSALSFKYGCGGGAGFGTADGGNAMLKAISPAASEVFSGAGGGLGNVGGSNPAVCANADPTDCSGEGRDGGGGGAARLDSTSGNGRGGSFGLNGSTATDCGGGGGVGGGGALAGTNTGFYGGAGGFGGGGGSQFTSFFQTTFTLTVGGAGGFGGGGGAGLNPDGPQFGVNGRGGFGAGDGSLVGVTPGGGGGAGMGGALFNHGGFVSATNSTWTDNRAIGGSADPDSQAFPGAGLGGAIFNLDGDLNILSSTLSGNRVVRGESAFSGSPEAAGGAVYNRVQNPDIYGFVSRVSIRASILANSVDGAGAPISDCNRSAHPDASGNGQLLTSERNVFESSTVITDDNEDHLACGLGSTGLAADPQLGPLADNGGLTPTMAIGVGSPAFDSAGSCTSPLSDQRGITRPQGAACDVGAFELGILECPSAGVLYVDRQAAAGGDGLSWATAFFDLQDALSVTDACEIWVAAGVYKPTTAPGDRAASFVLNNDVAVYGGFAGTETTRDQRDPQANLSVLSGDIDNDDVTDADGVVVSAADIVGTNSYNVTIASNTNATAVLDGFIITAGLANGGTNPVSRGGGMYISSGSPALTSLRFRGNQASDGGGLYTQFGNPVLTNVGFHGNRAQSGDGGGMRILRGDPTLTNASFSGNYAGSSGGGLAIRESSPPLINVSFSGNSAQGSGGGVYTEGRNARPADPLFRNAVFWNNQDSSGTGTADASLFVDSLSTTDIRYSLVQGCNPGGAWVAACGTDGGDNLADADPLFVATPDPADAPSAAGNLRLRARSPAVDAGDNSFNTTNFDLEGNPRVFGGTIDLGALETSYLGITLTTAGSGSGSVSLVSPLSGPFDVGEDVTVAATAATNSDFGGWSGDLVSSDNPLTFAISDDTAMIANFSLKTFEVSANAIGSGSITPPSQAVEFEGTANFSVAPATGWSLSSVSGDTCTPLNNGGTNWQASSITADCAVEAVFTVNSYSIGGTVTDLTGSGLELALNGVVETLAIAGDGTFEFNTALDHDTNYAVTIASEPTGPSQTCTILNDSGTINAADITDVRVTCVTNQYPVGGSVTGLVGDQLVLQNNGADDQVLGADGGFTFTAQDDDSSYNVTVLTQPNDPLQLCTVSNGAGQISGAEVIDVAVDCVVRPDSVFSDRFQN